MRITIEIPTRASIVNDGFKINVAGEGGEFESIVTYSPQFKKKLKIIKSRILEEDDDSAELIIEEVRLV